MESHVQGYHDACETRRDGEQREGLARQTGNAGDPPPR